jgi:predicted DCC family thiol-disulfide oxidoreductase YuxK
MSAAPSPAPDLTREPVLLFDGECGLCARSVKWLLRHERADLPAGVHRMWLAPLQGSTAAALRARVAGIPVNLSTVVFVEDGRAHVRSKAFMYMGRHLTRPWRALYYLRWMPGFLPDLGYRLIASLRYRIWGKTDACALPTPAQRARVLP